MNPRKVAFDILIDVFEKKQFSNKLLNKVAKEKAMSNIDIAFVFKLVYGTIQYKIYLEYIVNKIIDQEKTPKNIQILLWLSLYQIKYLNTPIHSVTNEAAEICKKIDSRKVGLVNKVVKNLNDDKLYEINIKNKQNVLALRNGYPFWLYKKWKDDYGEEIANQLVEFSNKIPPISFRVNVTKISIEEFVSTYKSVFSFEKSNLAKNSFITKEKVMNLDIYKKGFITIQDQASTLAVEVLNPRPKSRVLDMCCAPGGKLTHIAELMQNDGEIDGYELNIKKKKTLEDNINRLDLKNIKLHFTDSAHLSNIKYDYILLDAPCSGYGVIRKKPEIKLHKFSKEEVQKLLETQKTLLETAYSCMSKDSTLVYSTCTINKDENEHQIKEFITNHPDIKLIYERQIFGFENNSDGFYICKLVKQYV